MVIIGTKHINYYSNNLKAADAARIAKITSYLRRFIPALMTPLLTSLLIALSIAIVISTLTTQTANAKRKVEQYNLPVPQSYKDYKLKVEASTRRPEVGKPVILKAVLNYEIDAKDVEYQFLINGAPIAEPGMHKVHTFRETGTYKVSAVAKLGVSYLLNSPPVILHVIDSWVAPEAVISPAKITLRQGEDAVFTSLSETDPESRQWLYWSINAGHRGSDDKFVIKTDKLEPGQYTVELIVKDDRKKESITNAYLVIKDKDSPATDDSINNSGNDTKGVETLSLDESGKLQNTTYESDDLLNLELHSSHTHRLEKMQVVFWIQNAQPGADTQLQLDTGDNKITPWGQKLRYGHRYESFGIYTSRISARTPEYMLKSNVVTVYVWPLWLPVIMTILGLFLAGIPFFRRRQKQQLAPDPINYQHYKDPGKHQLILSSDKESPAIIIGHVKDDGQQRIKRVKRVSKVSDSSFTKSGTDELTMGTGGKKTGLKTTTTFGKTVDSRIDPIFDSVGDSIAAKAANKIIPSFSTAQPPKIPPTLDPKLSSNNKHE